MNIRTAKQIFLMAAASVLVGCGGDGGSDTTTDSSAGTQTSITGVAAAGLPLVGTVTVKDSTGATRTEKIGTNGQYSIDVSGMTPPFVFRATGTAGVRTYQIHAGATQADVGGVINVTPLTDLVLANVAGEIASAYFERNPSESLTAERLNAEADQLRQRLLPVLRALGVESAIDLLRTPFTPLSSALDTALDMLRVDYDDGVATITNLVTQQQITDAIATPAATEGTPPQLTDTTNVATAGSDLTGIRAAFSSFSALFADGLPSQSVMVAALSSGFLDRDQTADELAAELATYSPAVGARFTDVVLEGIDYANPSAPLASVSFAIKRPEGQIISARERWKVIKQGGTWRLHGDQRALDVDFEASMVKFSELGSDTSCRLSGLRLSIWDYDDDNNGGTIDYVIVKGPGLPAVGQILEPGLESRFDIDQSTSNGGDGSYFVVADLCNEIPFEVPGLSAIPADAEYTVKAYNAAGVELLSYDTVIPARPLTLTELAASTAFPTIAQSTLDSFASYSGGGDLQVTVNGLNPSREVGIWMQIGNLIDEVYLDIEEDGFASPAGQYSSNQFISALSGVSYRFIEAYGEDAFGRSYSDVYEYEQYPLSQD